jgi:carboxypeptidase C (cathepsin A)
MALCVSLAAAPLLLGADPEPSASSAPIPAERAVVSHGQTHPNGTTVNYTATAGTLLIYDAKQQATASMFYVAYTSGNPGTRPVTFCYNGGPGSSSIWLHMGAFGPKRVAVPDAASAGAAPYSLVDNEDGLLDKTDLVFIDAIGTGYSKIVGKGQGKDFYGFDQDAAAFGQFIQRYLTVSKRWNSPKYLAGESYGTTRSALLSKVLMRRGIALNGITLVSSYLNFPAFDNSQGDDEMYWLNLPTEAAVALYHHKLPQQPASLEALLNDARTFAQGDYLHVLALGTRATAQQRSAIAERLHELTGLSAAYIERSNLRVPPWRFEKELLGDSNEQLGRYDARYRGPVEDPIATDQEYDPSDSGISAAYTSLFNNYLTGTLHYNDPHPYAVTNYTVGRDWDQTRDQGGRGPIFEVTSDLTDAMTTNPALRVFSANGLYDLATPFFATEYSLDHMGYDGSLQRRITYGYYPAGHMIYLNAQAHAALKRDLDAFYDRTR